MLYLPRENFHIKWLPVFIKSNLGLVCYQIESVSINTALVIEAARLKLRAISTSNRKHSAYVMLKLHCKTLTLTSVYLF